MLNTDYINNFFLDTTKRIIYIMMLFDHIITILVERDFQIYQESLVFLSPPKGLVVGYFASFKCFKAFTDKLIFDEV